MAITSWNDEANYLYRFLPQQRYSVVLPGMILSAWVRNPTMDGAAMPCISQADGSKGAMIQPIGLGGVIYNQNTTGYLSSPTAPLASGWHHLLVQFGTTIQNQSPLYIDGIAQADPILVNAMDSFGTLGVLLLGTRSDAGFSYAGDFAEVAIWWHGATINSASLAANLAAGQNPLTQPIQPDIYHPLDTDYTTSLGATDNGVLTLVGGIEPTYTDHPPIGPSNNRSTAPIGVAGTSTVGLATVISSNVQLPITSINSTVQVGLPTFVSILRPISIGNTSEVGTPLISSSFTIQMTGFANISQIGVPHQKISPVSFTNTSIIGTFTWHPGKAHLSPVGIASTAQIPAPNICSYIEPFGLVNSSTIGLPSLTNLLKLVMGHGQPIFAIRQAVNLVYHANTNFSGRVLHNDPMIRSDFQLVRGVLNEVYFFIRDSSRLPMMTGDYSVNLTFDNQLMQVPLVLQTFNNNQGLYLLTLPADAIAPMPLGNIGWSVTYQRNDSSVVALWTDHDSPYGLAYVHDTPFPLPRPQTIQWTEFSPLLTGEYYSSSLPGAAQNSFMKGAQTVTLSMSSFTGTVRIDGTLGAQPKPSAEASEWFEIDSFDYRDFTGEDSTIINGSYVWLRVMVKPKSGSFEQLAYMI